jgi:hypothetical protein
MSGIRAQSVEWKTTTPLTANENRIIDVGVPYGGIFSVADCRGLSFFRYACYFNGTAIAGNTLMTVQVALQQAFVDPAPPGIANYLTLFTHTFTPAGSALQSTYNAGGILANNSGWATLQWPYVRIRLQNLDGLVDHDVLNFYAIAWG